MDSILKVKNGIVYVNPVYSTSLSALSRLELPFRYKKGKKGHHRLYPSQIVDLRLQFQPHCHDEPGFDPTKNEVIGMAERGKSARDFIYEWHFSHRHGFPSDLHSSGRGQNRKVRDIKNHPLSYILMCDAHHKEYDLENGEWRNPKNHKP